MGDIKYNWYFLSIRPLMGWTALNEEKRKEFLRWLIYNSSTYKIVLEKEGKESHIHALICLEEEKTTNLIYNNIRNNLIKLGLKKGKELRASTNIGGAIRVEDNLDYRFHYISGKFKEGNKDKSKDYYEVLRINLDNFDKDKLKVKEFVKTERKEKKTKIEKFIEFIEDEEVNIFNIEKFYYEAIGEGIITQFINNFQKDEFLKICYEKIKGKYTALSLSQLRKIAITQRSESE